MKKSLALLKGGFESSSGKTPEFMAFVKVFKKEFRSELKSIGATDIKFSVGHFYISGFFTTLEGQVIYFSLSDVRGMVSELMYRKAKNYTDYTGEANRYVKIRFDMITDMVRNF